jgi:hypothetical protein
MMIRINRPTDSGTTLVNGQAISTIEIVKLLGQMDGQDQYSLVITLTGQSRTIVVAQTTAPKMKDLIAIRDAVWKGIKDGTATIEVTGTDLPVLKAP